MDLEKYAKQVRQGEKGGQLDQLARSTDGEKLLSGLDKQALEKAAREGDMRSLSRLLQGVLSTPEGKRFAQQVQKAVQDGGR